MAVAVSPLADTAPLSQSERALARWLRFFALLFALGMLGFVLRPDDTVRDLDRVGALLRLPTLPVSRAPVASDFWLALAVANMAAIPSARGSPRPTSAPGGPRLPGRRLAAGVVRDGAAALRPLGGTPSRPLTLAVVDLPISIDPGAARCGGARPSRDAYRRGAPRS